MTKIAIVGGGCAAAFLLAELAARDTAADVTVIEPASRIGPGGAYSTPDPQHLLNVRAGVLGASANDPDGFVRWLREHGVDSTSAQFQPRARYGDYLADVASDAIERMRERGRSVEHRRARAIGIRRPERLEVQLDDESTIVADHVVVAIGPAPSRLPDSIRELAGDRGIDDPWSAEALTAVPVGATTLLIGMGLTAVDLALTTCTVDPAATVLTVSRTGLAPRAHLVEPGRPADVDLSAFDTVDATADAYAAAFDRSVSRAEIVGLDWRDVVDALRPRTQSLWRALPPAEQQRFFDHYDRAWECIRHRMAPAIAQRVAQLEQDGRLRRWSGPVEDAIAEADRVINCTGFGTSILDHADPFVRSLLQRRLAEPDALRIGVRADVDGRLTPPVGRRAEDSPSIYVIGALRRGELLETTAVVELRDQAAIVANALATSRQHHGMQR